MNEIKLKGTLIENEGKRETLGGYEVFTGHFMHRATVVEAGEERQLEFEFLALAYGNVATALRVRVSPVVPSKIRFSSVRSSAVSRLRTLNRSITRMLTRFVTSFRKTARSCRLV